jgi:Glutathione S-transferase, C-terminal domain
VGRPRTSIYRFAILTPTPLTSSSFIQINRKIIPSFDTLLITTSLDKQSALTSTLQSAITDLVNASHVTGPFFLGPTISFVDVMFAPWIIRLSRVLKYYRQWPDPEVGTRWESWVQAVESDERVRSTVSEEMEYHAAYERASQGILMLGMRDWAAMGCLAGRVNSVGAVIPP